MHSDGASPVSVTPFATAAFNTCSPCGEPFAERDVWTHCAINCPGRCPLRCHTIDGEIAAVHPSPQARACPRGLAMDTWAASPNRLRWPLRRVGPRGSGQFKRISWDEALSVIADRLRSIIDTYGNDAVLYTYGTGQSCTTADPFKRLLNCLGGFLDTYNNYSNAQITHMARALFGDGPDAYEGSDMITASQARMIVAFGTSPVETRQGGASTRRDWTAAVRTVLKNGGDVVVVDPRRTPSMIDGVEWLPIRPGTDGALASALAYEFLRIGACDLAFLERLCVGFTDKTLPERWQKQGLSYCDYVRGTGYDHIPKTPAWAQDITGIPAAHIERLAARMAAAQPLFVMQGWGPQRRSNGEMTSGAIMALPLLLGQVGAPGTNNGLQVFGGGGRLRRLPKGPNPVGTSIPCFLWSDAVERGHLMTASRDGVRGADCLRTDVKCIINYAGNCLTNQHGNLNRSHDLLIDESLCSFILAIDVELCDSALYADIVLPDLFRLEQPSVLDAGTFDPYVTVGSPATTPRFERRSVWDVCCVLANRLGVRAAFDQGISQEDWARALYEADRAYLPNLPPYEAARTQGVVHLPPGEPRVALRDYLHDPQAHPLPTPSGKIELFSAALVQALETRAFDASNPITPVPTYVPEWFGAEALTPQAPLQLVGFHYRGRIHSSWGNVDALKKAYPQTLWIHPADADARTIRTGDEVAVRNEFGELRVRAQVTSHIMPGVLGLPQGSWHNAPMNGDRIDQGACINVLTTHRPSPLAKGNPQHSIACQVERVAPCDQRLAPLGPRSSTPPGFHLPHSCAASVARIAAAGQLAPLLDNLACLLHERPSSPAARAAHHRIALLWEGAPWPSEDAAQIDTEFDRLFEPPAEPLIDLWGSLWLDSKRMLWGPSTLGLRAWTRAHGLEHAHPKEPDDHVALVIALAARIATEQPQELAGFMKAFVTPWVPQCLAAIAANSHTKRYRAVAEMAQEALALLAKPQP